MGKVITSPVKAFKGEVVLSDPLTYAQVIAFERANQTAAGLDRENVVEAEYTAAWLPGVCACVEEWRLEGRGALTPDTFPATPRAASVELLSWLITAITKLTAGDDDPNG